jgi:hypothetical protein
MQKFNGPRRVCAMLVMVISGSFLVPQAFAQSAAPSGTAPAAKKLPLKPSARPLKPSTFVSPYARAAAQREGQGQAPAGHPQSAAQLHRSKPHAPGKPHS